MSKFWSYVCNMASSGFVGCFLMMQVDETGYPLYHDFLGIHICILVALGTFCLNAFRAGQVCVYGEEF